MLIALKKISFINSYKMLIKLKQGKKLSLDNANRDEN